MLLCVWTELIVKTHICHRYKHRYGYEQCAFLSLLPPLYPWGAPVHFSSFESFPATPRESKYSPWGSVLKELCMRSVLLKSSPPQGRGCVQATKCTSAGTAAQPFIVLFCHLLSLAPLPKFSSQWDFFLLLLLNSYVIYSRRVLQDSFFCFCFLLLQID